MIKAHLSLRVFLLLVLFVFFPTRPAGAAGDYFGLLSSGATRLSQRDFEGAMRFFQEAVSVHPEGVEAHYYIGVTHSRTGKLAEGEASFKRVLALDPAFSPALYELGVLYFRKGEDAAALSFLGQAEKVDPKRARVHYYQGLILKRQGKKDEATAKLNQAKALDPEVAEERDRARDEAEKEKRGKRWGVLVATGLQYDENIILEATGDVRPGLFALEESGGVGVFYLQGLYRWLQKPKWIGDVEYRFYQNAYFDDSLRDFHIQDHQLWLKVTRQVRPIELTVGGDAQYTSLGGEDYLSRYRFGPNLSLRRKNILTELSYRAGRNRFYDAGGRFLDHPNRNVKTDRVGLTQSIFWKQGGDEKAHIGFFFEQEEAGEGVLQDDWSFHGNLLNAGILWHPWPKSTLAADLGYTIRRFTDPNKEFPGEKRQDDGPRYSVTLSQSLPQKFEVSGQYLYQRNHSNIPLFDYRRSLYGLFLVRRF